MATHAHTDHIGNLHEFDRRAIHHLEADVVARISGTLELSASNSDEETLDELADFDRTSCDFPPSPTSPPRPWRRTHGTSAGVRARHPYALPRQPRARGGHTRRSGRRAGLRLQLRCGQVNSRWGKLGQLSDREPLRRAPLGTLTPIESKPTAGKGRNGVWRTLRLVVSAALVMSSVSCSSSGAVGPADPPVALESPSPVQVSIPVDDECRNASRVEVAGEGWNFRGRLPTAWREREAVDGVLLVSEADVARFEGTDGRLVLFTQRPVDAICIPWE